MPEAEAEAAAAVVAGRRGRLYSGWYGYCMALLAKDFVGSGVALRDAIEATDPSRLATLPTTEGERSRSDIMLLQRLCR